MDLAKISQVSAANALSGASAVKPAGSTSVTGGSAAAGQPSFLDVLQSSLDQVNRSQVTADQTAQQYQLGQGGVTLEDAMVSMQKANITFQTAVQVRNKLVAAYNDIMNMQV